MNRSARNEETVAGMTKVDAATVEETLLSIPNVGVYTPATESGHMLGLACGYQQFDVERGDFVVRVILRIEKDGKNPHVKTLRVSGGFDSCMRSPSYIQEWARLLLARETEKARVLIGAVGE